MQRKYDRDLVKALSTKAYKTEENGLSMTVRPVPDDNRPHVLDSRIRTAALNKMSNPALSPSWKSLRGMRYRPDKQTASLTRSALTIREQLLEITDRYIDLYIFTPEQHKSPTPCLVYFHGGGFMAGNILQFENQLAYIAEQSGCVVVYPEYRLAPETSFPGQIEDCTATVRFVISQAQELGVKADAIMVAGDSAGGSLSNACIQSLDPRSIAYAFEIYPEVGMGIDDGGYDAFPVVPEDREAAYYRIDHLRDSDSAMTDLFVHGKTTPDNPLISALSLDDFSEFPPMTVVTSEYDPLRLADEAFARKARSSGIPVELIRYGGVDHGFFDLFGTYPQSEDVCLLIAQKLRSL